MATSSLLVLFALHFLFSRVAGNANEYKSAQARLAYAGSTGMVVSWNTPQQLDEPKVYWGTSPDQLSNTASSRDSITYQTSTTYNNHVKITGLEPNTQYYYRPSDWNASQPMSFRTSRVAGDHTPFTAAVVVDLGTMGHYGLTTHVGNGSGNPLKPGERNTIQALRDTQDEWDFLWHGISRSTRTLDQIC